MNKSIKIYKGHIAEISRMLEAVTELTGFCAVWKSSSGNAADSSLPAHQSVHCNSFCRKIKSHEKLKIKCSLNDCVSVMRKAEKIRSPFLNRCHAGVSELIVPLFLDDTLDSVIFIGPLRRKKGKCFFDFALRFYEQLNAYDCKKIEAVKKLFPPLSRFILEKRESFIRSEISERAGDVKIQKAIGFINSNFRKAIQASDAAELCGLSVSRFVHLFKEECGMGFSDFIKERRMEEARKLLEFTDMKIYDVASRCGYSGQCYFGMVFRKARGVSPLAYRRKKGKNISP